MDGDDAAGPGQRELAFHMNGSIGNVVPGFSRSNQADGRTRNAKSPGNFLAGDLLGEQYSDRGDITVGQLRHPMLFSRPSYPCAPRSCFGMRARPVTVPTRLPILGLSVGDVIGHGADGEVFWVDAPGVVTSVHDDHPAWDIDAVNQGQHGVSRLDRFAPQPESAISVFVPAAQPRLASEWAGGRPAFFQQPSHIGFHHALPLEGMIAEPFRAAGNVNRNRVESRAKGWEP